MDKKLKKAIEEYQCSGCVCGGGISCYEVNGGHGHGCKKHVAGTRTSYIGKIFLGMPTGFNRVGFFESMKIYIFNDISDQNKIWQYDKFNIPVWKYKNKNGHILIRGLSPRVNTPFLHIILDDNDFDKINCFEIMDKDINDMD